jgi:hypothetical protein
MTDVNIPLLRKAVEWAEAEAAKPERLSAWNQSWWAVQPESLGRSTDCGTCYCIAGFIASMQELQEAPSEYVPTDIDFVGLDGGRVDASDVAMKALGVTDDKGLFYAGNTIEDVRRIAESIAGESL